MDDRLRIVLTQTCSACPEQYDAHINGKRVGYLRMRHGRFTVWDEPGGTLLYSGSPPPRGDGMFEDDERDYYLSMATEAIAAHVAATSELDGDTP